MSEIRDYHAHVYFDADSVAQAVDLCTRARDRFGVTMGRVHEKCVGPHPMWSCQLAVGGDVFAEVLSWLALNRNGLIVFAHLNTGNDLKDHTDHVIWLGQSVELKLSVFN
jgi:DOPA 4,5-dioxygenase